jgi:hypothetical protein
MLTFANRFFDKTTVFENARTLIKSSFVGLSRDDYISLSKGAKATQGADKVLEIAKQEKSLYAAVKLCFIVMEEMLSASNKYYDNNGYFDDTAKESIGVIGEKFSAFSPENEEFKSAFELTMDFLPKIADSIEPYGIRTDIVKIFIPFCTTDYVRQGVEKHLEMIAYQTDSDYYRKLIQQLRYAIISLCDGESDASNFAHDHLENNEFRKMIIEQSIEKKDYDKALRLCIQGEKKDADHCGLQSQWKELRYRIYVITGDIEGQKELAYKFAINGNFDYYTKLKKLDHKNIKDWQTVFKKIIAAVSVPYHQDFYAKILMHENMKPELLEYCKKHIASIPKYYLHLLPDHQREVDKLFLELLRKRAANADSRYLYKEICDLIQKYAKASGSENAYNITQEFKLTYPKRPAFMEELGKVRLEMRG